MKLPLVLFLTALASRQIQARVAIDSRKPGAVLQTTYTGTLHEPDEHGEERCVGTFRGTNSFEHNCHHLSEDCWESFARKCKEIFGGIIHMVSRSCGSDNGRTTVNLDMKSRIINNGKPCSHVPALTTVHPVQTVHPAQPVRTVPVRPVHHINPIQSLHPVQSVYPVDPLPEPIFVTEPEYTFPEHYAPHQIRHLEKAIEREERLADKHAIRRLEKEERLDDKLALRKLEREERLEDKHPLRRLEKEERLEDKLALRKLEREGRLEREERLEDKLALRKLEREGRLEREERLDDKLALRKFEREERERNLEHDLRDKEMARKEKLVDDEFVDAAIHDKEQGIELLEKQKKELELLRKSVDKTLHHY